MVLMAGQGFLPSWRFCLEMVRYLDRNHYHGGVSCPVKAFDLLGEAAARGSVPL